MIIYRTQLVSQAFISMPAADVQAQAKNQVFECRFSKWENIHLADLQYTIFLVLQGRMQGDIRLACWLR